MLKGLLIGSLKGFGEGLIILSLAGFFFSFVVWAFENVELLKEMFDIRSNDKYILLLIYWGIIPLLIGLVTFSAGYYIEESRKD